MVISRLTGGLGNQLFQYACGRYLSLKNQVALKLDITKYHDDKSEPRAYSLSSFAIEADIASREEIRAILDNPRSRNVMTTMIGRFKPYYRKRVLKERHYHFDAAVLRAGKDVYLDGYWQSEKYFIEVSDVIRRELNFKTEIHPAGKDLARQIGDEESVCIFVRRAELVSNPHYRDYHGFCTEEYYAKAIELVAKKLASPYFFVFSDDIWWCNRTFAGSPFTIVSHLENDALYVEYFRLMSLCKHFVISNSTYAWWAAWLGRDPSKVVVAPQKWFNTDLHNTRDLVPSCWKRI